MYEKIVALSMTPELQSKIDNGEARLLGEDEYICPNCGVYDDIKMPKLIHYTEGGPWFENYRDCEFHAEWKNELFNMMEDEI